MLFKNICIEFIPRPLLEFIEGTLSNSLIGDTICKLWVEFYGYGVLITFPLIGVGRKRECFAFIFEDGLDTTWLPLFILSFNFLKASPAILCIYGEIYLSIRLLL